LQSFCTQLGNHPEYLELIRKYKNGWFIAPAGLPPETVQALHADIVKVLADPEIRQQLDRQSMEVLASSPAEFAAAVRSAIEHWKQAVKESGARLS
jgi:tripartite-type tricarboxylate transporter receptor subunit TctC